MPEPIREVWAVIQDDGQVVSMSHDRDSVVADLDFVEEHMDEPDRLWRGESVPGLTLTRLPIRTDAETAVIAAAEEYDTYQTQYERLESGSISPSIDERVAERQALAAIHKIRRTIAALRVERGA